MTRICTRVAQSVVSMGEAWSADQAISDGMHAYFKCVVLHSAPRTHATMKCTLTRISRPRCRFVVSHGSQTYYKYLLTAIATIPILWMSDTDICAGIAGTLWSANSCHLLTTSHRAADTCSLAKKRFRHAGPSSRRNSILPRLALVSSAPLQPVHQGITGTHMALQKNAGVDVRGFALIIHSLSCRSLCDSRDATRRVPVSNCTVLGSGKCHRFDL